jgi:hypothetical protein
MPDAPVEPTATRPGWDGFIRSVHQWMDDIDALPRVGPAIRGLLESPDAGQEDHGGHSRQSPGFMQVIQGMRVAWSRKGMSDDAV